MPKGNLQFVEKDPLAQARAQLDFPAFSRGAPSVKDVLFKAQTMVPLAPPKPWWKLAASVGGALLLAAAVLLPWVPRSARLAQLSLVFDKAYTRAEAQQLVDATLRNLTDDAVLAGAAFTPLVSGEPDRGLLTINLNSHRRSPAQLSQQAVFSWDDAAPLAAGVNIASEQYTDRQWLSPLKLAAGLARREQYERPWLEPGRSLARAILSHAHLYSSMLAEELASADPAVKLTAFEFIQTRGAVLERRYDFELPAWPAPLGVSIEHFVELSAQQQASLRQHVGQFARRMNLADCSLQLAGEPQPWLPVLVDVRNGAGASDRMLTARLQAFLRPPGVEQLLGSEDSVGELIDGAMREVLPGRQYRVDYLRCGSPLPSGLRPYLTATITVGEPRSTSLLRREQLAEEDDPEW